MQRTGMKLLYVAVLLAGCKPPTDSAILSESGGTIESWRMRTALANTGQVTIDRQSSGSGDDTLLAAEISSVGFEVAAAPDANQFGTIANPAARQYLPLRMLNDNSNIAFNAYIQVPGYLCYVNNVLLNDTFNQVLCKSDADVQAGQNEQVRSQLARKCQVLAATPIDGGTGMYATFSAAANQTSCHCLNGQVRDVQYVNYYTSVTPETDFTFDCERNPLADSTDSNATACSILVDQFKSNPPNLQVLQGSDYCLCGAVRLQFNDPRYVNKSDDFKRDCQAAVGVPVTVTASGTATGTGTGTGTRTFTATAAATPTATSTDQFSTDTGTAKDSQ